MYMIDPSIYQALAVKHALILYHKHGVRVNRAYTPARMMATAAAITKRTFKPRDYIGAAQALQVWIAKQTEETNGLQ